MLALEVMMGDVMVMIEIINEGEAGGLALGCVGGVIDSDRWGYGSPRKEKMIWICFGERSLRWGE